MTLVSLAAIAVGLAVVRLGWGRHVGLAVAGWLLAGVGAVVLTATAGAWGFAVGMVTGTVVALAAVLLAGWRSPARAWRPGRVAPAVELPVAVSDLARRIWVFVLVVPCAFVTAQWFAFAVQAFARSRGAGEANSVVLALLVQPVAWLTLMTVQMTRADATGMAVAPVVAALLGTAIWSLS